MYEFPRIKLKRLASFSYHGRNEWCSLWRYTSLSSTNTNIVMQLANVDTKKSCPQLPAGRTYTPKSRLEYHIAIQRPLAGTIFSDRKHLLLIPAAMCKSDHLMRGFHCVEPVYRDMKVFISPPLSPWGNIHKGASWLTTLRANRHKREMYIANHDSDPPAPKCTCNHK